MKRKTKETIKEIILAIITAIFVLFIITALVIEKIPFIILTGILVITVLFMWCHRWDK